MSAEPATTRAQRLALGTINASLAHALTVREIAGYLRGANTERRVAVGVAVFFEEVPSEVQLVFLRELGIAPSVAADRARRMRILPTAAIFDFT